MYGNVAAIGTIRDYYKSSPAKNPTGPDSGDNRVVRGGAWAGPAGLPCSDIATATRPGYRGHHWFPSGQDQLTPTSFTLLPPGALFCFEIYTPPWHIILMCCQFLYINCSIN
jgi:hypothetical protein